MTTITVQSLCKSACLVPSTLSRTHQPKLLGRISPEEPKWLSCREATHLGKKKKKSRGRGAIVCGAILPVDPWAPNIDSQSIASQLFAFSLFPYIGFLYFITKSKSAPKLTLFGFYFLLTFVGATIPAGIYAKVQYGTSLSNVDWLHGGAESFLTLTNLFIVMGLREALRNARDEEQEDKEASI